MVGLVVVEVQGPNRGNKQLLRPLDPHLAHPMLNNLVTKILKCLNYQIKAQVHLVIAPAS